MQVLTTIIKKKIIALSTIKKDKSTKRKQTADSADAGDFEVTVSVSLLFESTASKRITVANDDGSDRGANSTQKS